MARNPRNRPLCTQLDALEPRLLMTTDPILGAIQQPGIGQPAQLSPEESTLTLREIHTFTGVEVVHRDYGLTGAGQTVVVIDSGIAYDHEALGGGLGVDHRVVGGWDFTEENDADPYDDGPAGFHGTHVAGIIASSDGQHTGVAPDVDIVALRVFNDQGRGKLSWLETSLNWVIDNADSFKHPVTTVNMSIGTDWNSLTLPEYAKLEDEFDTLNDMGIFVAVAAGNRFDPDENGLSYPAVSSSVTPVASSSSAGTISEFSQRHTRALVAPGENITSTVPDYIEDFNGVADDFYSASGTSMASPYIAGASILVRQAMLQAGQTVTVDAIREVFFQTAEQIRDETTGETYHRINVAGAVESILGESFSAVVQEGTTLIIRGTVGDDAIRLDQFGSIKVNGQMFRYSPAEIKRIDVRGDAGDDRLIVDSRFDATQVRFSPGEVELRSENVMLKAQAFERIDVHALGRKTIATFVGSAVKDELFIKPTHSWMENGAYLNYIRGADSVVGWANDTYDTVMLHGSLGNDSLIARPESTSLRGDSFESQAIGYSQVVVRGVSGGIDEATIVGTAGGDVVRSKPTYSSLKSSSHFVYVEGFEETQIDGHGGNDTAKIYDSAGDDEVVMESGRHRIRTSDADTSLVGFTRVEVYGSTGQDVAELVGSAASEQFTAKPTHTWMEHGSTLNYVRGFDSVVIDGGGGTDSARLYDSQGNDRFRLAPQASVVKGVGFEYSVNMISRVHAFSHHGTDTAEFVDSQFADKLYATVKGAWMKGPGFTNIAESFERVLADSDHGADRLILEAVLAAVAMEDPDNCWIQDDGVELIVRGFGR